MGLLDTPALSTYQPQRPIGGLMAKLQGGQTNAALCVLGDSTGASNTRWPYLVTQQLAAMFPNYRVRFWAWNATNLNFDPLGTAGSSTQLQAGTAPGAVTDTFTRADSATLGNSSYGYPWVLFTGSAGTIGIASNKATVTAASAAATLEVGWADHTGSIDVTLPANKGTFSSVNARVYLRTTTSYIYTRYVAELYVDDTSSSISIFKVVANGTPVTVATFATPGMTYGGTYTLSWSVIGTAVSITVNGHTISTTIDAVNDDQNLLNGTAIGIASANQYVGLGFANLVVNPVAPTLDVYNASVSGQVSAYSVTNLAAQIPVHPDQVFLNYGHNESTVDARPAVYALMRDVREYRPRASLAVILQNPRSADPATTYSYLRGAGFAKNATIAALCAEEGVAVVNVFQRFLRTPNYATTLLNTTDGLHPSDGTPGIPSSGGSPMWADEVMRFLAAAPIVPQPGGIVRESRKFFPAPEFMIVEGTPTLGRQNGTPAWSIAAAAISSVSAACDIPGSWQTFNVYAIWDCFTAAGYTGANNQVQWELLVGSLLQPTGKVTPTSGNDTVGPTALASVGTSQTGIGNNGINYTPHSSPWLGLTTPGRPLLIQVRRKGTSDTVSGTVNFRGVVIERAS